LPTLQTAERKVQPRIGAIENDKVDEFVSKVVEDEAVETLQTRFHPLGRVAGGGVTQIATKEDRERLLVVNCPVACEIMV
jgi:hypothetical protein